MIRVRDTLIPIDHIRGIALMYDNERDVYFIYVDAECPQMFFCTTREQGEQELGQIQVQYISIVKEMSE
jgi:hypothetical protein